jgi:Adenylylsulfate kinase and related kinases
MVLRHGCTEGTREAILAKLMAWATEVTSPKIYWLTGMAGTGKTTIAHTFSEILNKNQMLCVTFFCSRQESDCNNTGLILPTLAYQLARCSPAASQALVNILEQNPDAGLQKNLNSQFNDLIFGLAKTAFVGPGHRPVIIIIDALDECAEQKGVTQLLSIISQYASKLPFKFFLTSRPEQKIGNRFNQPEFERHSRFVLHDVEEDVVAADIELYFRARLNEIAHERRDEMPSDSSWPSEEQFKTLVNCAGKLFIYAATVCEYVERGKSVRDRLDVATGISGSSLNGKTEILDNLYGHIVATALDEADLKEKMHIRNVLQVVISARNPMSINAISALLQTKCRTVHAALQPLHAVLHIPSDNDYSAPISTFHASFPDFITNQGRSRSNYLDLSHCHQWMALQCLALIQPLKENICGVSGQLSNAEIGQSTIKEHIPEGLAYACTHWPFHVSEIILVESSMPVNMHTVLQQFLDCNVLQWTECMSLLQQLDIAIEGLKKLEIWGRVNLLFKYYCVKKV